MTKKDYTKEQRDAAIYDLIEEDELDYGDEDQNTLMRLINKYEGDYDMMNETTMNNEVKELIRGIDNCDQAIDDAVHAKAAMEKELAEILTEEVNNQK